MKTVYLDGQFLKVGPRTIEAFTPGAFNAQGVFETMLGLDGVVLDAALHIRRLRAGLKTLGIKVPVINQAVLKELLVVSGLSCARVRLMVWQAGKQTHTMAVALPYKVFDKKIYRLCLVKTDRVAHDRMANVKSLDHGLFAGAFARAQERGFDEALLVNRSGHVFEASRANIFWMKGNILYTPPLSSGCLNGITRGQVMQAARRVKIPVQEKNLTSEILKQADTAFLTNSLIGIKLIEAASIGNISTMK